MQRYFSNELKDNQFILNNDDYYHIKTVMRMNDNNEVLVVYNETPYVCHIENIKTEIKIIKDYIAEQRISNLPYITLILPVLKEQKFDLVLQKSVELGISKIIPVITERSIVKVDQKETKKLERWRKIVKEASEQSHRATIPEITEIVNLKQLKPFDCLTIMCSTQEKDLNINFLLKSNKNCDRINIVIGPEGGLSSKEEEYLKSIGATSTTLGANIMRVETVPLFLLSIINYEYME